MAISVGRSATNVLALLIAAGVAPAVNAAWTNPGPGVEHTPVSAQTRPLYEVYDSASSSTLHSWLRFSKIDGTLNDLTGSVENGTVTTNFAVPYYPGHNVPETVDPHWVPVYDVDHTRRVFLLGYSGSGTPVTLEDEIDRPSWFSQTSSWLSSALTTNVLELSDSTDQHIEIPNDFAFGSSHAAYRDFEFVVEHDVYFKWDRYRAYFANSDTQDFFSPPSSYNTGYWHEGSVNCVSGDVTPIQARYYKLEKKTVRVYFSKDKITAARSLDTRLTFGQPDSTGAIPSPDPNEPSQYVNFTNTTYKGGLFLGQAETSLTPKDRSGKCIIQAEVPVQAMSGGTLPVVRAMTLFCPDRRTDGGYSGTASVMAVHPNPGSRTLADLIADPQRWGERWPVPLADPEDEENGEPLGHFTLSVEGKNSFYTWLLGADAIDDGQQLVALYPAGIKPALPTPYGTKSWHYFMGPEFFASTDVPSGLKVDIQQPRVWTVYRSDVSPVSPVLSQYHWGE